MESTTLIEPFIDLPRCKAVIEWRNIQSNSRAGRPPTLRVVSVRGVGVPTTTTSEDPERCLADKGRKEQVDEELGILFEYSLHNTDQEDGYR